MSLNIIAPEDPIELQREIGDAHQRIHANMRQLQDIAYGMGMMFPDIAAQIHELTRDTSEQAMMIQGHEAAKVSRSIKHQENFLNDVVKMTIGINTSL